MKKYLRLICYEVKRAFVKINFGNAVNIQWFYVQVLESNVVSFPLHDAAMLPL